MGKEIILYRHKTNKDFYLLINWSVFGGEADTDWFTATNDIYEAVRNAMEQQRIRGDKMEEAYNKRPFPNKLLAKTKIKKDFDFDGYKGELTKELVFNVSDFEKITLAIKEDIV